jgi:hypothetical protein
MKMSRFALTLPLLAACTVPSATAPDQLQGHAELVGLPGSGAHGSMGSADIGFGRAGCCDVGVYVADARLSGAKARDARVTEILQGGFQLGVTLPLWQQRLRLRGRFGRSGSPPESPLLGRSGFGTSAALTLRLWDVNAPDVNQFKPNVDLLLGWSTLALGNETASSGSLHDPVQNLIQAPLPLTINALMLGLRVGADFGLDLE